MVEYNVNPVSMSSSVMSSIPSDVPFASDVAFFLEIVEPTMLVSLAADRVAKVVSGRSGFPFFSFEKIYFFFWGYLYIYICRISRAFCV